MNKSYTLFVSFIVALGGFLLGFDSAVISGAVSGIRTYFEMSDWELGFSVGCVIFGAMSVYFRIVSWLVVFYHARQGARACV